jgi:hypothetical protein
MIIPIVLVSLGAIQIFWALSMSKKQGRMWCYLGISGSTIIAIMWIFAVTVLPAIFDEFIANQTDYYSLYSSGFSQEYGELIFMLGSLQPLIQGIGFLIISIRIICIATATLIVVKEQQKTRLL